MTGRVGAIHEVYLAALIAAVVLVVLAVGVMAASVRETGKPW